METFQTLNPRKQMKLQFLRKNFLRSRRTRRGVIISVNKVFGGRLEPRRAGSREAGNTPRSTFPAQYFPFPADICTTCRREQNRSVTFPSFLARVSRDARARRQKLRHPRAKGMAWGILPVRGTKAGEADRSAPGGLLFPKKHKNRSLPVLLLPPLSPSERIPETVLCVSH